MALLTARSSTIFIATGDRTRVFHSVEEVPPALRQRLQESTRSLNAATILIADKRGREELVRALQGEPSEVKCRLAEAIRARQLQSIALQKRREGSRSLRRWLEFLLPVVIGASLWFFIESHF
ncbi:MAG: hypothetical protein JO182_12610 [Acidobacteriaceae bacterium]|nr:hypothetical protein [Acidobacteriaceae bacterium]MBV9035322.1 hypothetical protein [Acidobacteriaceae bacterium]MBV9938486.1 hypothetical protein [Acidobacteriaceae bacterium]